VRYWDVSTDFIPIFVIALGLSADCFAVSLAAGVALRHIPARLATRVSLAFGIFQAGMTLVGWLAGSTVIDYISGYDHWLAFALLAFVGGHMLWEAFHDMEGEDRRSARIASWPVLFILAVATSLDALAVGLSFAFLQVRIFNAAFTIGLIAAAITVFGLYLGRRVGRFVGRRAEIVGGLILISIGVRILFTHLFA
jgi:putative Mn2+ efflux pump MntP